MSGRNKNRMDGIAGRALALSMLASLWILLPESSTAAAGGDGRWAVLVAGISGEPDLQVEYLKLLKDLRSTLENDYRFEKDKVFLLYDDVAKDPGAVQYQSTRDNLARVCRDLSARISKDDFVFFFFLGHGSYDGSHYKLNLVGPDPTEEDLAAMLHSIPSQHLLLVNSTSGSGASLAALSGRGRVVITATKSGSERNRTRFGGFFVEALKLHNADTDKNGRLDLLEAFQYASRKVEESYSKEGSLQTEHPVLDDDGDGQGHAKPEPANGDGLIARTTFFDARVAAPAQGALSQEQRQSLLEAQDLEKQIEALKYAKSGMPPDEYEKKLEELLLKLAQLNAKNRKK